MRNIRLGAAGKALFASRVRSELGSDWQDIDAENDDGVDGIIFLRNKNVFSGRMINVQIKAGEGYQKSYRNPTYNNIIAVDLGKDYLSTHKDRWSVLSSPVILIYIPMPGDLSSNIYWQDLKSENSYSRTNLGVVLIPKENVFGAGVKGIWSKLCGAVPDIGPLPIIDLRQMPRRGGGLGLSKQKALEIYRAWRDNGPSTHAQLGKINVTNSGWRHITRKSRKIERIEHSFQLLGAAQEMIRASVPWRHLGMLKRRDRSTTIDLLDHLSLRAEAVFHHRNSAPVQVILRRVRSITKSDGAVSTSISFLSVHELSRGRRKFTG